LDSPASAPVVGQLVICSDVIEHVVDPDVLLGYLRTCTGSGGLVILSTPERHRLRGRNCIRSPNPAHVREWSFGELRRYLEARGFRVRGHFLSLPTRIALNRLFWRNVVRHWISTGRSPRYNQVCLLETR
jgi:hypothetical protein